MSPRGSGVSLIPGLALVASLSALAYMAAQQAIVQRYGLAALTLAILAGAMVGNLRPAVAAGACRAGLEFSQRRLLRLGVALYGFNLSFQQVVAVGRSGVLIDLAMVGTTLAIGWLVGTRLLGMDRETVLLTAAGSAICGAAAVVATVPMLGDGGKENAEKGTVAVATVVLFGTSAMFIYPLIHRWTGGVGLDFGSYVGSTVHEVAQVVAIGNALGSEVAGNAVIVKMIRVMLLVPFLLSIGFLQPAHGVARRRISVPWFAVAFVAIAALNSLDIVPAPLVALLRVVGVLCLTAAMAALGVATDLRRIGAAGIRPLLLGGVLFAHLVVTGALVNRLLG